MYYFSPTGHKLRSRPDVFAFLELVPEHKRAFASDGGRSVSLRASAFSFSGEALSARGVDVRLARACLHLSPSRSLSKRARLVTRWTMAALNASVKRALEAATACDRTLYEHATRLSYRALGCGAPV